MAGKANSRTTTTEETEAPPAPRGEHVPLAGKTETGGRRVDPPGQNDNEHSQRPDTPPGLERKGDDDGETGGETLTGTDQGETLGGGAGDDSIDGGAGDDTITGGDGADKLRGGEGADVFKLRGEAADDGGDTDDAGDETDGGDDGEEDEEDEEGDDHADGGAGDLDSILDFTTGEDTLDFGEGLAGSEENFATGEADDYAAALAAANAAMEDGTVDFVAIQVGEDVIVFADTDETAGADTGVVLVGRTLTDVGFGDIG